MTVPQVVVAGRYRIVGSLGNGGMGRVRRTRYEAFDWQINQSGYFLVLASFGEN